MTAFLGIDLSQRDPITVVVDGNGAASSGSPERAGLSLTDITSDACKDAARDIASTRHIPVTACLTPGMAAALAEHWCGAARDTRSSVVLNVGANVQAGITVNGQLMKGTRGLAGAAGWLALNPVEREDYRRLGCLEAEVGDAGIVRRLVWRIKSGDRTRALELAGGTLTAITTAHVFQAARNGDGVAISVVRDTAKYLGMAIANLIAVVDPDIVVLGGLVASAADLLLEPSRAEVSRRLPPASQGVAIVPSALGDSAAAVGAARAAMIAE